MRDLQQELDRAIDAGELEQVLELTVLIEQQDREQAKQEVHRCMLALGLVPRSLVRERYTS